MNVKIDTKKLYYEWINKVISYINNHLDESLLRLESSKIKFKAMENLKSLQPKIKEIKPKKLIYTQMLGSGFLKVVLNYAMPLVLRSTSTCLKKPGLKNC